MVNKPNTATLSPATTEGLFARSPVREMQGKSRLRLHASTPMRLMQSGSRVLIIFARQSTSVEGNEPADCEIGWLSVAVVQT